MTIKERLAELERQHKAIDNEIAEALRAKFYRRFEDRGVEASEVDVEG